ncbi:MAG: AI-2E family transporter [Saprospiraceae bacterium]
MTEQPTFPFYVRVSHIAICLIALFFILYIGKDIIVPLLYATVFAILLNPAVNWLHSKGLNRPLSILVALLVAIAVVGSLLYLIAMQIGTFLDTLPVFKAKFAQVFRLGLTWTSETFNIKTSELKQGVEQMKDNGMGNIGKLLGAIGGVFVVVFLLPVYIFMILFYKPLLLEFISRLFAKEKHEMVVDVLIQTRVVIQSYLIGLLLEASIVAALNCTALLLLGIQYAILLGIMGALLNVIPYIGGLIALALPVVVALTTKEPVYALYVLGIYTLIQLIDNNVIVPKIVASKVKLNALVSIVAVLLGGALWGIAGMFLAIPLTAIIKVIMDRIEPLKPLGFLLGDNVPPIGKTVFHFRKQKKEVVKKEEQPAVKDEKEVEKPKGSG